MTKLTIGMATYNDYEGVYFTVQALRLYQNLEDTEILIVDNYGCEHTKRFAETTNCRYMVNKDAQGTAWAKDHIFANANGIYTLCIDCHVLLVPDSIAKLKEYYEENPDTQDLLQGPLLYDDNKGVSTHFDPVWRGDMYGVWATDERVNSNLPFEIPMQGMGLFSCKTDAWPWFNALFRGFGGEEFYIHEKFRKAGNKCLCLPFLKWMHRFHRPHGVPYKLTVEDKIKNYIIGWNELGLDLSEIVMHFGDKITLNKFTNLISDSLGKKMRVVIEEDEEEENEPSN